MHTVHDATLVSVSFDWELARVTLEIRTYESMVNIVAERATMLLAPRQEAWGPSVHINKVDAPSDVDGGQKRLHIEMQSGDSFIFPSI
jgi:hypothetical protein